MKKQNKPIACSQCLHVVDDTLHHLRWGADGEQAPVEEVNHAVKTVRHVAPGHFPFQVQQPLPVKNPVVPQDVELAGEDEAGRCFTKDFVIRQQRRDLVFQTGFDGVIQLAVILRPRGLAVTPREELGRQVGRREQLLVAWLELIGDVDAFQQVLAPIRVHIDVLQEVERHTATEQYWHGVILLVRRQVEIRHLQRRVDEELGAGERQMPDSRTRQPLAQRRRQVGPGAVPADRHAVRVHAEIGLGHGQEVPQRRLAVVQLSGVPVLGGQSVPARQRRRGSICQILAFLNKFGGLFVRIEKVEVPDWNHGGAGLLGDVPADFVNGICSGGAS